MKKILCNALLLVSMTEAQQIHRFQSSPRLDDQGLPKQVKAATVERITDEALAAKKLEQPSQWSGNALKAAPVPERVSLLGDLYQRAIIITAGEVHTTVPQGSVIHIPADLSSHVVSKVPENDLVLFPEFLKQFPHLVETYEVTLAQVHGEEDFSEALSQVLSTTPRIVIASLNGGLVTTKAQLTSP